MKKNKKSKILWWCCQSPTCRRKEVEDLQRIWEAFHLTIKIRSCMIALFILLHLNSQVPPFLVQHHRPFPITRAQSRDLYGPCAYRPSVTKKLPNSRRDKLSLHLSVATAIDVLTATGRAMSRWFKFWTSSQPTIKQEAAESDASGMFWFWFSFPLWGLGRLGWGMGLNEGKVLIVNRARGERH